MGLVCGEGVVDNGVIRVGGAAGVRQGGNLDGRDVFVLNIPNVLQSAGGPVGRTNFQVFHVTFEARVISNVTGVTVVGRNQRHEAIEPHGRVGSRRFGEQGAARDVDGDLAGFTTVREGCAHPINRCSSANLDENSYSCGAGNDSGGVTGCNDNGDIGVVTMNNVGAIGRDVRQEVLTPDLGEPTITSVSQTNIKMMVQGAAFRTDAEADIANTAAVAIGHAASGQRDSAGCTLIGGIIEGPGVIVCAGNRFQIASNIGGEGGLFVCCPKTFGFEHVAADYSGRIVGTGHNICDSCRRIDVVAQDEHFLGDVCHNRISFLSIDLMWPHQ